MKIGDKILCIKDHIFADNYVVVRKNKIYIIENIEDDKNDKIVTTTTERGTTYWSLSPNGAHFKFHDFFVDNLKEQRKLKLKKLNEKSY
jgi:hypothetical protein